MLAHEAQEGMEAGMFGGDLVGCGLDDRRDMIANLFAHVANERLEDFLFRTEIGVEAAECRPGAAGDGAGRRFVKTLLAEFARRGTAEFAQCPQPALLTRRLDAPAGAAP